MFELFLILNLIFVYSCFFIELIKSYYSRKCNYDCSKCKNIFCDYFRCQYLKNKKNNSKE